MPDEVREHLTRDQRSFLHPESLQILQMHNSMTVLLLFRENLTRDQRSFLHPESLQISQIPRSMTVLLLFREHLTRDQRSFLHPESLQISQIPRSMTVPLLFSSPHSSSTGFRSEDWTSHSKSLGLKYTFLCCFWGLCLDYCTVGRSKHGPL